MDNNTRHAIKRGASYSAVNPNLGVVGRIDQIGIFDKRTGDLAEVDNASRFLGAYHRGDVVAYDMNQWKRLIKTMYDEDD